VSSAYAIVIGIQSYQQSGISGVNYAHEDVRAMAKLFEERFEVPRGNIKVWLDQEASFARIANELKYDASQLEREDKFYFFYAGHGYWSADGGNRLTAWDTHPSNPAGTTVSLEEVLLTPLRAARCRTSALFIDACATKLKTDGAARDLLTDMRREEFIEFTKNTEYTAAFFSCSPEEKSWSSPILKHGVWTFHLERALRGEEPDAIYRDKFVTSTSLQDYLLTAVRKFTREKMKTTAHQTPYAIWHHNGTAPLITLPEPPPLSGKPLLDPDFSEAYFVGFKKTGYKWLPGFNKKIHTVPTSHSESAANFARRLLSSEVSEELQTIVAKAKDILKLRYRDLNKNDDEAGSGTVDTDAFRFAIEVNQSRDDHTDAVVRREVRLRTQHSKLPKDFDSIFPEDIDTLVVPLRNTRGRFVELRDAIEDRGLDVDDANETTERLKVQLHGGVNLTIDMQRGRMTVRIPGTSGTLPLIERFDASGGPEIAGPTPKLIGKKKSED
jgi:hypothetical protein